MPSSMNWVDGAAGGTPVSAANLNKLAVTADVGTAGTPTGDALRAAFVPKWKANTAYVAGEPVLNPSGQTVTANASFTSGSTYSAANWTVVSGGGGGGAVSSVAGRTGAVTLTSTDLTDSTTTGQALVTAATAAAARTTLGLGTAATQPTSAFDAAGAATTAQGNSLQKASNLSDLASATTARTNLGLGTAATLAAGSASGVATLDGTGNVPAGQLNNVGKFNQATSIYNATPAGLHKVRAALGKAQAGVGLATFVCLGDSTTAGNGLTVGNRSTGSHPVVLRSLLGTKGYPSGGDGFIPAWSNVDDPRVTRSAGWTQFGASTNPGTVTTSTAGSTLTFAGLDTCVAVDIYYLKPTTAGQFSWAVDGGTATNITTTGSSTVAKVSVSGLTSATHSVVLTAVSGTVYIIGVVMKKASGVLICNVATSGITAVNTAGNGSYTTTQAFLTALAPDYTQIMLGVNDFGAQNTISAYTTAMQALTTTALATGDVGYTVPLPPNTAVGPYTGTNPTFPQFVTAIYGLADTNNAQVLDMQHRWTSWAVSQPIGYYNGTDPVHGSDLGYADVGRAELNLLAS